MKKALSIVIVVFFAAAMLAVVILMFAFSVKKNDNMEVKEAKDYSEVFSVIERFNENSKVITFGGAKERINIIASEDSAVPESGVSVTNVQTAGLDEGDKVKTDGKFIYKLNPQGCVIVEAEEEGELSLINEIVVDNYVPRELFITANKKLVMLGGISEYGVDGFGLVAPDIYPYYYSRITQTDIRVYDISDPSVPALDRQLVIDGSFNTARLIESENRLLFLIDYNFYYQQEKTYIPKITDSADGGEEKLFPVNDILYFEDIANFAYLITGSISLNEPERAEIKAYLGLNGSIYVSPDNIFVATYDYRSAYKKNIFGWSQYGATPSTRLVKLSLADLKVKGAARAEGEVKSRYSLDEYGGYLRVATTTNTSSERYSNVFVFDSNMKKTGEIKNIADGESIYAVRFNGDTGSLVTFRQIDPYFNLDLKDPYSPKISDGLKEPGVSFYVHYIDNRYTLGIGKASNEEQTRLIGLKVTLYDNSSGEAENVDEYIIYGDCYAEILYEPKALLYMAEKGIFAFAYEKWDYNYYNGTYGIVQGLAVFNFDVNAESDKMVYRTTLSNISQNTMAGYNTDYYLTYYSFVGRGLVIGKYIYTVSDRIIVSYDAETLIKKDAVEIISQPTES